MVQNSEKLQKVVFNINPLGFLSVFFFFFLLDNQNHESLRSKLYIQTHEIGKNLIVILINIYLIFGEGEFVLVSCV